MNLARLLAPVALALAGTLTACNSDTPSAPSDPAAAGAPDAAAREPGDSAGSVFAMTNAAVGNEVVAYARAADGSLTLRARYATGGRGSGGRVDPLQSSKSLLLSNDGRLLFAVNAGSNEISVFRVRGTDLTLVERAASGGQYPNSLTLHRDVLYVLNNGGRVADRGNTGVGSITGFIVRRRGRLAPIPGSTRAVSGPDAGASQVAFTPDGRTLVVTERRTDRLLTYAVDRDGRAGEPRVQASAGATPFAVAFAGRSTAVVPEAFGAAPNAAAVSSYELTRGAGAALRPVTPSLRTGHSAACWIAVTPDGRFAYTTNAGSSVVTGFSVARNGALALLNADGRTGLPGTGTTPLDVAVSRDGNFLYTLNTGTGTVGAFRIAADGALTPVEGAGGLPVTGGANGIAAS